MIVGDAGGNPNDIAAGVTSSSIVLSPDGLKKKKKVIKSFSEYNKLDVVERWNPFSDLDNHKLKKFFLGNGEIEDAVRLFDKMVERYKAGKWNYAKPPLQTLADITQIKLKLLTRELRAKNYSDEQINIGKTTTLN